MKKQTYLIIELLQSFSKKELKRFQQLVAAPFFNSDESLIAFLNLLLDHIRKSNFTEFDLTLAFNTLFSVSLKKLNAKQSNLLHSKMSLLLGLAQQFLKLQILQDKQATNAALLQEAFLAKKQFRLYEQFFKKEKKGLKTAVQGIDFYEHQFVLENGRLSYHQISGKAKHTYILSGIKENLSLYYLLNQLDLYLLELTLAEFYSVHQVDHSFFEALVPLLQLAPIQSNPLVKVYQSVINLLHHKTDQAFFKLKDDLDRHTFEIPIDSLINFYNSAINFCVLQLRKGIHAYDQHLLDLYKSMDDKDLLFDKFQIHLNNLRNIITQSCKLEEFDWATGMLDKYESLIPQNIRKAVKNFYLGCIAYFKKDYQLAIDYLFTLPNINLSHDVNRRIFMIKAYYELDTEYLETTQTLFRSFEKYIREHKSLTSKSKTSYKNFIRTLINLYRIKHNVTKMKLENLKLKLEAQKLNSNKSWLLKKIGELE